MLKNSNNQHQLNFPSPSFPPSILSLKRDELIFLLADLRGEIKKQILDPTELKGKGKRKSKANSIIKEKKERKIKRAKLALPYGYKALRKPKSLDKVIELVKKIKEEKEEVLNIEQKQFLMEKIASWLK